MKTNINALAARLTKKLNAFPGFVFKCSIDDHSISFDYVCKEYFLTINYDLWLKHYFMVMTCRLTGRQQFANGLNYTQVKINLIRIALLGF